MIAPPPETVRRIVYFGTPELAVAPLIALHDAGYEIPLVVSRGDKRRGRGSTLRPSPVKAAALELGLPVSSDVDDALHVDADLGVVVAFGRLIKPHLLAELPLLNLHFSLLPRWRGAAPVERAILAGDTETGVCLMQLEEGLDTGPVYRRRIVPIGPDDTLETLRATLVEAGTELLLEALADGLGQPLPQEGEPTYAPKLDVDELRLRFDRPAIDLIRTIRLGRAWAEFRGERLRIWRAEPTDRSGLAPGEIGSDLVVGTGAGGLRLLEVQPAGKGRMAAEAWRNGARPASGERLE